MPITRKAANRHTVVSTGWTNPTNAYALSGNNVYATLTSAKSSTLSGDFGFPDFTAGTANDPSQTLIAGTDLVSGGNIAYGNGFFVVPTGSEDIWWTTDPNTWTLNSLGALGSGLNEVIWDGTRFVVAGYNGNLRYATDPSGAWTSNTQGSSAFEGIGFGNGYYVACGQAGLIRYRATDPTGVFTANNQGSADLLDVEYANGYWVAVGVTGTLIYRATDPTGAWTSNAQGTSTLYAVAYGNGFWVAVGDSGTVYYKATNPTGAWTSNTTSGGEHLFGVSYSNGWWVAVGASGVVYTTTDPTGTWTKNTSSPATQALVGAANGNSIWVMIGVGGDPAIYTDLGIPNGSTINSVKVKAEWKMDVLVTGGLLTLQPRVANANQGTATTQSAIAEAAVEATYSATPSLAQLQAAQTSDTIEARVSVTKGSTNTAMVGSLDYVYLEVDWTASAPTPSAIPLAGGGRHGSRDRYRLINR